MIDAATLNKLGLKTGEPVRTASVVTHESSKRGMEPKGKPMSLIADMVRIRPPLRRINRLPSTSLCGSPIWVNTRAI